MQPSIKVNGKDKLGSADSVPHELQQLKQKLAPLVEHDRLDEAFRSMMQWMVNFLVHSQIIETKQMASRPVYHNDIYSYFVKSFQGFDKVCSCVDVDGGAWVGPVVDHYSSMLIEYAENADFEIHSNPF